MTNGDKVRQMTNDELQELWSTVSFPTEYVPDCFFGHVDEDDDDYCEYPIAECHTCPLTFRNWLDAEVEE